MSRVMPERDPAHEALMTAIDRHSVEGLAHCLEQGTEIAPASRTHALFAAAFRGFDRGVALLLAAGAEVDARNRGPNWGGLTPLMAAALQGHTSTMLALFEAGADPDATLEDGRTAALMALQGTYGASAPGPDVARLLFAHGASPSVVDENGQSPLLAAAERGQAGFVRELLNPDARLEGSFARLAADGDTAGALAWTDAHGAGTPDDAIGWPPVYWACLFDDGELVTALCAAGEDPEQRKPVRYPPGLVACYARAARALAALLRAGAPPKSKPRGGAAETLSDECAKLPDQALMGTLLDAWGIGSAEPPKLVKPVKECLLWCLKHGFPAEASRLLEAGVSADLKAEGHAALLVAAMQNDAELVSLLLGSGAKPDALSHGWRALHWSVGRAGLPVVEALIGGGADVDKADKLGNTPLHLAVRAGCRDVCEALVSAGAAVKKNKAKRTPWDEAQLLGLGRDLGLEENAERPPIAEVFAAFEAPACDAPPTLPWANGDAESWEHERRRDVYGALSVRRFRGEAIHQGERGAYAPFDDTFELEEDVNWQVFPDPPAAQLARFREAAERLPERTRLGMLFCIHGGIVLDVVSLNGALLCYPIQQKSRGEIPHPFALTWDGDLAWVATSDPEARGNAQDGLRVATVAGAAPAVLLQVLPGSGDDAPTDLAGSAAWLDRAFARGLADRRGWCA